MLIDNCPFCNAQLEYEETDELCFEPGPDRFAHVLQITCASCGAVARAEGYYNIDIGLWTDKAGKRIFPPKVSRK